MTPTSGSVRNETTIAIAALSALVVRQARQSMYGRLITGTPHFPGCVIGLTRQDREAMSLVSRASLQAGLPDYGAEIHELLKRCTRPLGSWWPTAYIREAGLDSVCLINDEDATPTEEAWELASGFGGVGASIEELLFQRLMEQLSKQPDELANHYYTTIREFVIRHPIATHQEIYDLGTELAASVWECVQPFYEPIPEAWSTKDGVPTCKHCGNVVRKRAGLYSCRSNACGHTNPTAVAKHLPLQNLMRVSRAIHQYWVEPGVDEIRLFDALRDAGMNPELYPMRDRVDIAVGCYGLDLKSYSSPEMLGAKIRKSKGGLNYYEKKRLVIPDWLCDLTPRYLERVTSAMEEVAKSVTCMRSSEVFKEIRNA